MTSIRKIDAATGGHLIVSFPLRVRAQRGEWVQLIGSENGNFDMGTYKQTFIANDENVGWFPAYRFEQVSKDLCNKPQ